MPKEATPSVWSAIKKLRALLTREEKLKWLVIVGFALLVSVLEVVTASVIVVFAQVLNDPAIGKKYVKQLGITTDISTNRLLFAIAIAVGVIYLIKNLITAAEVFFQNFSIQKMNVSFKKKLLNRYVHGDYSAFLMRNSSYGFQVIKGDVEQTFSTGMVSLASMISESSIFLCLVMMVIYMNPVLAFMMAVLSVFLGYFVMKFCLPQFYHWGQRLQQTGVQSSRSLLQLFHAFKEIFLFNKQQAFIFSYQKSALEQSRLQAMKTSFSALPRMAIEVLFIGVFVVTTAYLCLGHHSPVAIISVLSGYLYVGFRLMPGINRIINQLNNFKSVIARINRIYEEFIKISAKEQYANVKNFSFSESINLKNVSFRYKGTESNVLTDLNLEIKKGACVGIIGETGSGKSTLVDLVLGLLSPTQGEILIDQKHPVQCYQWLQKIGYVPQSLYLIDSTIEANIAFGEEKVDQQALHRAIDMAQLRIVISQLPEKEKTVVGERGIRLSGGERQRIAIARALYRDPEILIFDEATSALDNKTEANLMQTIKQVCQNRTVIMIAHRLTTLEACDLIVTLKNKEVIVANPSDASRVKKLPV